MIGGRRTETIGLVQQFLERAGQLYSLPAVAAEVLRLTDQPQIDPRALKHCLESDPALAARILRVANSSLFAAGRPVTDLNQALTLLGIRPLKMLVLGFSLPKELLRGLKAEVLADYWRLALTKAVAARELCEQFWHLPGDEAFFAGLVQDLGVLVLLKEIGESYETLLCQARTHGLSLLECELDTLGFDHLVLSARLLSHWGLPPDFCAAVSVPPDERRIGELTSKESKLPRILHLAHLLCRVIDQPHGTGLSELLAVGLRYFDLDSVRLQGLMVAVQQRVGELGAALSLQLPDGRSYLELLAEAQQRLAEECVDLTARKQGMANEKSVQQWRETLRDDVMRSTRNHRSPSRMGEESGPGTKRSSVVAAARRKTTVGLDDAWEPALESKVALVIQQSRQSRRSITLAIIEIDCFADLMLQLGPDAAGDLIFELRDLLGAWAEHCSPILLNDSRLALLWENASRSEAVELAREILLRVHPWARHDLRLPGDLSLSIGLAALDFAPKNYPARQLVEAALGCLSAAQLSGGNTVKSIAV